MQVNFITKTIKERMNALSLSAAELSRMTGVQPPALSRLLNGSKQVNIENIYKILSALDLLKTNKNNLLDYSGTGLNSSGANILPADNNAVHTVCTASELETELLNAFRKLDIKEKIKFMSELLVLPEAKQDKSEP